MSQTIPSQERVRGLSWRSLLLAVVATVSVLSVSSVGRAAPNDVSTLAGAGTIGAADGAPGVAQFTNPYGIAVDSAGNSFVADAANNKIRKISPAGVVSTFAGDGGTAQLNYPFGVALDATNNVYVADSNNHRIRKITPGGVATTVAGTGVAGFADGAPTTAQFNTPTALAVDGLGNIFVADGLNYRVRRIDAVTGTVTTLAGTGTAGFNDGPAATSVLNYVSGIAVAVNGDVLVADYQNHRIRKISAGIVSTFAGTGAPGFSNGPVGGAQLNAPIGVAIAPSGAVYVADQSNHRIRRIDGGVVTTAAGSGISGFVNGTAPNAQFSIPSAVAVGPDGSLYICDTGNQVIRKVETSDIGVVGDSYIPVTQTRLFDSRLTGGPLASGSTNSITVAGVGGVPANASAVVLNIAAVRPAAAGHIRIFPLGSAFPEASVVNFAANKNTPNVVVSKVGVGGQVSIYAGAQTDVIVDVSGYFVDNGAAAQYFPNPPTRILSATVPGATVGVPAASTVEVEVVAPGASTTQSVVLNIGALNPTASGHLRVFPSGDPLPNASTHNFAAGDSRMNLVVVKPGINGKVSVYNASAGTVNVTVDRLGEFRTGSPSGGQLTAVDPIRALDTRIGGAPIGPGDYREVQIVGFGGVPNSALVSAAVVNVAAVTPGGAGSIDVGPSGTNPALPSFTHPANENVANLIVVSVGVDGKIRVRNNSAAASHVIVDITAYFQR
jgi:sugar lactone lactonase YvrE